MVHSGQYSLCSPTAKNASAGNGILMSLQVFLNYSKVVLKGEGKVSGFVSIKEFNYGNLVGLCDSSYSKVGCFALMISAAKADSLLQTNRETSAEKQIPNLHNGICLLLTVITILNKRECTPRIKLLTGDTLGKGHCHCKLCWIDLDGQPADRYCALKTILNEQKNRRRCVRFDQRSNSTTNIQSE